MVLMSLFLSNYESNLGRDGDNRKTVGSTTKELVKLLLQRRYTVHATVRSLDDPNKTQHLLALDGAKERLSLFEANLTEEGSFESAVNGCECVFHMATPVIPSVSVSDPKAKLIDPAVKGTLNVLKSAAKVSSLKRVVLTSSMSAVMFRVEPREFGAVVDETCYGIRFRRPWSPSAQFPTELPGFREMIGEGKVVCVTGASGFIASWLVKLLLQRGYTVHATVRSLDDPKKTQHLRALDGAPERLSLFEANLGEEGSFESAVNGCQCVFHTASPVIFSVSDPKAQLLDPAVKGTLNVLKSAAKVPSLKRVVLTSSIAAVLVGVKPPEFGAVVDETWFSDPETCEQKELWYPLSKTLAEDAAVKFSENNGLELVVINPGFVIGPILQPTINITSKGFIGLIETGKEVFPDGIYRLVDVRDVANAHILAFENPEASGRYIMVADVNHSSDIMKIVNQGYPAFEYSERYKDSKYEGTPPFFVSRTRAESLGVQFTTVEVSIKDTVESLKERKLLSF
ncbi:unnamed protein product [Lactuca saligna]|uniref:Dihydroflavonol 4-reductase n=1 Tax=Lactuca saligna TaxID=75948 RepID=A0AA35YRV0_LACSI|nr:unnamed protein product [Lactuca saligna]